MNRNDMYGKRIDIPNESGLPNVGPIAHVQEVTDGGRLVSVGLRGDRPWLLTYGEAQQLSQALLEFLPGE